MKRGLYETAALTMLRLRAQKYLGALPGLSNFGCLPGRAGGSPISLGRRCLARTGAVFDRLIEGRVPVSGITRNAAIQRAAGAPMPTYRDRFIESCTIRLFKPPGVR